MDAVRHGDYKEWYDNESIWVKEQYVYGKKHGLWRYYSDKEAEKTVKARMYIKEGVWTFQTDKNRETIHYKNDKKEGFTERYYSLGNIKHKALFKNDSLVNVIFDKYAENKEDMPSFKGGDEALLKYLSRRVKYPRDVLNKGIEGTVEIKFVVEKNGEIGEIIFLRGICNSIEENVERALIKLPKFTPGSQNGEKVRVWYEVPVTFKLEK